jgi:hypothetical protein
VWSNGYTQWPIHVVSLAMLTEHNSEHCVSAFIGPTVALFWSISAIYWRGDTPPVTPYGTLKKYPILQTYHFPLYLNHSAVYFVRGCPVIICCYLTPPTLSLLFVHSIPYTHVQTDIHSLPHMHTHLSLPFIYTPHTHTHTHTHTHPAHMECIIYMHFVHIQMYTHSLTYTHTPILTFYTTRTHAYRAYCSRVGAVQGASPSAWGRGP